MRYCRCCMGCRSRPNIRVTYLSNAAATAYVVEKKAKAVGLSFSKIRDDLQVKVLQNMGREFSSGMMLQQRPYRIRYQGDSTPDKKYLEHISLVYHTLTEGNRSSAGGLVGGGDERSDEDDEDDDEDHEDDDDEDASSEQEPEFTGRGASQALGRGRARGRGRGRDGRGQNPVRSSTFSLAPPSLPAGPATVTQVGRGRGSGAVGVAADAEPDLWTSLGAVGSSILEDYSHLLSPATDAPTPGAEQANAMASGVV